MSKCSHIWKFLYSCVKGEFRLHLYVYKCTKCGETKDSPYMMELTKTAKP